MDRSAAPAEVQRQELTSSKIGEVEQTEHKAPICVLLVIGDQHCCRKGVS